MPLEGKLTVDEAKRVAAMGGRAEIELVVPALDTLYEELRRLEIENMKLKGAG